MLGMMAGPVKEGKRLVLQPAVIIDPASRTRSSGHWLLLDGPKIAGVGSGEVPADAQVVPLPGKTVMPGFVDSHGHVSFRHALGPLREQLETDQATLWERALANLRSRLAQGITLMRDLSERNFLDVAVRKAQVNGTVLGPRLRCATRGIRAPQGHGFCGTPFEGVQAIRQAVRDNQAAGANLIKIYLTGSLYGTPDDIGRSYFSVDEVRGAVEEAHRLGLPVSAHAFAGEGIELALKTGIDCIEHGLFPDDRQIDAMAKSQTWLSTTYAYTIGEQAPAAAADRGDDRLRELAAERLARMLNAGVLVAAGTDEGSGGIAHEASALAFLGMPPWLVLDAITSAGARLAGMGAQTGALRPGLDADMVVLDGDPLDDLGELGRVHAVVQGGRVMTPAQIHGQAEVAPRHG